MPMIFSTVINVFSGPDFPTLMTKRKELVQQVQKVFLYFKNDPNHHIMRKLFFEIAIFLNERFSMLPKYNIKFLNILLSSATFG
jgi:hypothetical protein